MITCRRDLTQLSSTDSIESEKSKVLAVHLQFRVVLPESFEVVASGRGLALIVDEFISGPVASVVEAEAGLSATQPQIKMFSSFAKLISSGFNVKCSQSIYD